MAPETKLVANDRVTNFLTRVGNPMTLKKLERAAITELYLLENATTVWETKAHLDEMLVLKAELLEARRDGDIAKAAVAMSGDRECRRVLDECVDDITTRPSLLRLLSSSRSSISSGLSSPMMKFLTSKLRSLRSRQRWADVMPPSPNSSRVRRVLLRSCVQS